MTEPIQETKELYDKTHYGSGGPGHTLMLCKLFPHRGFFYIHMTYEDFIMNDKVKMKKTGDIGENLVAKIYRKRGHQVTLSENYYDSVKDMLIDGQTCEVKTQKPYYLRKEFTIKPNQVSKCTNADILIWVESPSTHNNYRIDVYEAPKKDKRRWSKYVAKDKYGNPQEMRGMSVDACKLIYSEEGSIDAFRLMNNTVSDMSVVNKLNVN